MQDLSKFIEQERKKANNEQQGDNNKNPKSSLIALKNAIDGVTDIRENPIVENIKKVDTIVGNKKPNLDIGRETQTKQIVDFNEKDDQFTKDLLMKTRNFVNGSGYVESKKQQISEEFIQPEGKHKQYTPIQEIAKNEVLDALKDTITELYVKEKVVGIINEYLNSDEGKKMIRTLVIGLFKKKK